MILYTVTTIDVSDKKNILGIRRIPVIYSTLQEAIFSVRNNSQDLSDGGTYLYIVVEETRTNVIRPALEYQVREFWFRYNSAVDEYEPITKPDKFSTQSGFGVG